MRRTLAAILLLCSPAVAATAPERVPEHSLVTVQLTDGERGTVFSASFVPVEVYHGDKGFAFTGPPGRYAVLVVPDLPTAPIQTLFVTIGGSAPPVPPDPGPTPPTPPDPPPLTGFSKDVYDKAVAVGDKENARKLGATFRQAVPQIGTTHATLAQVYAAIREATRNLALPAAQWTTFNTWLSGELTKRAQTMDSARTTFDAIATGLEAAAL
jgi:hypothetical protein